MCLREFLRWTQRFQPTAFFQSLSIQLQSFKITNWAFNYPIHSFFPSFVCYCCCYGPHRPYIFFFITVNIKSSKLSNQFFSQGQIELMWTSGIYPFSSPSSLLPSNWPLTFFFGVGDGFYSPTSFFTNSRIIGFDVNWQKAEIRSAEVHITNWPFLPHTVALLLCFEGAI